MGFLAIVYHDGIDLVMAGAQAVVVISLFRSVAIPTLCSPPVVLSHGATS
jgi:hypothetical protein